MITIWQLPDGEWGVCRLTSDGQAPRATRIALGVTELTEAQRLGADLVNSEVLEWQKVGDFYVAAVS